MKMKIEIKGTISGLEFAENAINNPEPTSIGKITLDEDEQVQGIIFGEFKTRVPADSVLGQKVKITVESLTQE